MAPHGHCTVYRWPRPYNVRTWHPTATAQFTAGKDRIMSGDGPMRPLRSLKPPATSNVKIRHPPTTHELRGPTFPNIQFKVRENTAFCIRHHRTPLSRSPKCAVKNSWKYTTLRPPPNPALPQSQMRSLQTRKNTIFCGHYEITRPQSRMRSLQTRKNTTPPDHYEITRPQSRMRSLKFI